MAPKRVEKGVHAQAPPVCPGRGPCARGLGRGHRSPVDERRKNKSRQVAGPGPQVRGRSKRQGPPGDEVRRDKDRRGEQDAPRRRVRGTPKARDQVLGPWNVGDPPHRSRGTRFTGNKERQGDSDEVTGRQVRNSNGRVSRTGPARGANPPANTASSGEPFRVPEVRRPESCSLRRTSS